MAQWEKLLRRMVRDTDPRNYDYEDAAHILDRLGFAAAPSEGSHRKWRFRRSDGLVVVIGLVKKGHGKLKPVYIRDMVKQLRTNGLLPAGVDSSDGMDKPE